MISRSVDIGQTVAASLSAPILFLIANDLARMQVKASVDEADIGKITNDVQVTFTVDAYSNDTFEGKIAEVRLEPTTVQNVVTYSVIITVENPQLKLKPGMTANLTMVVDQHENVLTVPNSALRFRPAGVTQEKIAELLNPQQGTQGTPAPAPTPQAEGSASVPPIPSAESAAAQPWRRQLEMVAAWRRNFGDGGGNRGGGNSEMVAATVRRQLAGGTAAAARRGNRGRWRRWR